MLTGKVKQARTIETLLCTYSVHESHLNDIHLSACWISFGRLARHSAKRYGMLKNEDALEPLVQCTVQAARTGDIGMRALVNIAYGAACGGAGKQMSALFMRLARAGKRRMAGFTTQILANTAWAFAIAG